MQNIMFLLDSNELVGPTYKDIKNDVSCQLADIFNNSFSTGVFPTILKVVRVVPLYKKDFKLHFLNYRPVSLLFNIENINVNN